MILNRNPGAKQRNQRNVFKTSGSTRHVRVAVRPTSSIAISLVGAKAAKSKMKRPPVSTPDCDAGYPTRPSRLNPTAVIGLREPFAGEMPSVMRVRCAAA
jgi:hypothetical protein